VNEGVVSTVGTIGAASLVLDWLVGCLLIFGRLNETTGSESELRRV